MSGPADTPGPVQQALELAAGMGFAHSCMAETGRLLRVLAAACPGTAAELGTGCGAGTAWILAGLPPEQQLVTVEIDPERASAVRDLFAGVPNLMVLDGDWHHILPYGPFHLLFVDAGAAKHLDRGEVIAAVAPGGLVVLDDLTPERLWPEEWRGRPDPVRDFWLHLPGFTATLIAVSPTMEVILAARMR